MTRLLEARGRLDRTRGAEKETERPFVAAELIHKMERSITMSQKKTKLTGTNQTEQGCAESGLYGIFLLSEASIITLRHFRRS